MRIIYTKHTLTQIKNRGISLDDIITVLNEADDFLNDHYGNSIAQKMMGKYLLRVFYRQEAPDRIIIITTYRTSNLNKYFRK